MGGWNGTPEPLDAAGPLCNDRGMTQTARYVSRIEQILADANAYAEATSYADQDDELDL